MTGAGSEVQLAALEVQRENITFTGGYARGPPQWEGRLRDHRCSQKRVRSTGGYVKVPTTKVGVDNFV